MLARFAPCHRMGGFLFLSRAASSSRVYKATQVLPSARDEGAPFYRSSSRYLQMLNVGYKHALGHTANESGQTRARVVHAPVLSGPQRQR